MKPIEKIRKALSFEQGPIPVDFGANPVTGIHCSVVADLRDYYGLEKHPIKIVCPYQMLGIIEDDLKQAMGIDTDSLWSLYNMFGTRQDEWKEWQTSQGQTVLISKDMVVERERDGGFITYAKGDTNYPPSGRMPEGGFFFDAIERQEKTDEEDPDWHDNVEEFQLIGEEELQYYRKRAAEVDRSRWIAGSFGGTALGDVSLVPASMLTAPKGIRTVADWYVATLLRPEFLHRVFSFQVEAALENLKRIHAVLGEKVNSVYVCGSDFGTQAGPLCSPETYRNLFLPYHKQINAWIHEHTEWKTFKHSCGAVEGFIDSFIEAGFDIINPIQWTAAGMDREYLKKKYHGRVVFWGGGVDTQHTLPFGTPEDVRKEVLEVCRIFGRGGGFVFSSIHNIQAGTPVENAAAMLEAVKLFNEAG